MKGNSIGRNSNGSCSRSAACSHLRTLSIRFPNVIFSSAPHSPCVLQEHFRDVTGLPINPYFSAYKFVWLLENVPEAKAAVEDGSAMFGTIDTYLIWRLTGVCVSLGYGQAS